jgi:hypothetical protein
MQHPGRRAVLVVAYFSLVGCQDVQPASTPDATLAQTGMDGSVETDREDEVRLALRLEALEQSWPAVVLQERNPFEFGMMSSRETSVRDPIAAPDAIDGLQPTRPFPVTLPPVRLRMIGLVEPTGTAPPIVVLTDGDIVLHGQEGDVVDGRYRIINIATTSVEIELVADGSRQVLRLAGS